MINNFIIFREISLSLLVFICLPLIQSCSGNQIGKSLSKSFDSPIESKPINTLRSQEELEKKKNNEIISKKENVKEKKIKVKVKNNVVSDISKIPFIPSPYRITLKLSKANPLAPAEKVTKALRKAGILFEVERIERIQSQDGIRVLSPRTESKIR